MQRKTRLGGDLTLNKCHAAMMVFMIISFLGLSTYFCIYASAQGTRVYGVAVQVGDSATYTVNQYIGALTGYIHAGDSVKFVVQRIETVSINSEDNKTTLTYEQADCNISVNDSPTIFHYIDFFIPAEINSSSVDYFYLPFLPAGSDFMKALSSAFPSSAFPSSSSFNVSVSDFESKLTFDSYYRTGSIVSNISESDLYHTYESITIETSLGMVSKADYLNTDQHTSNQFGGNYTITNALIISLTSVRLAAMLPAEMGMPLTILAGVIPGAFVIVAYVWGVRKRKAAEPSREGKTEKIPNEARTEGRESVKDQLLNGLSYQKLLKIAQSVSMDIKDGTGRETLVKSIKDSLSVQEIKTKVAEP